MSTPDTSPVNELLRELRLVAGAGDLPPKGHTGLAARAADEIERLQSLIRAQSTPKDEMLAFFLAFFEGWPEGSKLTLTDIEALERARAKVAAFTSPGCGEVDLTRPACGQGDERGRKPTENTVMRWQD
jgi:hypothetical protein